MFSMENNNENVYAITLTMFARTDEDAKEIQDSLNEKFMTGEDEFCRALVNIFKEHDCDEQYIDKDGITNSVRFTFEVAVPIDSPSISKINQELSSYAYGSSTNACDILRYGSIPKSIEDTIEESPTFVNYYCNKYNHLCIMIRSTQKFQIKNEFCFNKPLICRKKRYLSVNTDQSHIRK